MKRHVVTALFMLLTLIPAGAPTVAAASPERARVVAEERIGPRLVDLSIQSPALGGQIANVRLLTPEGWEQRHHRDRWPVLYLLHGMGDDHTTWTQDSDVQNLPELRDVLVVMPDAELGYYTDWWNGGAGGPPMWETFHLDEMRPILERNYGAGTRRVVAGLSMGGFGAVSYAGRRPGMFRAAASYSGPVHLLHPSFVEQFQAAGPEALVLWGDPVDQRHIWKAHDPYVLARRLRHIPVYLSSGDGTPGPLDPPGAPADEIEAFVSELSHSLAARLRRVGGRVTTHFTTGTHSPPYWERELHRSLPMLLEAL